MSVAASALGLEMRSTADGALTWAARTWFAVTAFGQLIFAVYVAVLYGGAVVYGDLTKWNVVLPKGYIAGDTVGNLSIGVHMLFTVLIVLAGLTQLTPAIRSRAPSFHRWTGRFYMLAAVTMSLSGLYLVWVKGGVSGDATQSVAISVNALLILIFAALALRYAMARNIVDHRRWALRLFMVVSGVWFFRIGIMFWVFVNRGPVGFDPQTFTGPFLTVWSFGQYLLPLAVLEMYLRIKDRGSDKGKSAMAASLFVISGCMCVGIFVATVGMWLPRL